MSSFIGGPYLSSGNGFWNTPSHLKQIIYEDYDILFDPCPVNPHFNGLECEWLDRNFCNPPFHETEKWVKKILEELKKGRSTVLLMPARTCTSYFHELILPNVSEIVFIRGRVRYTSQDGKRKAGASPWPSILCVFTPSPAQARRLP